MNEETSLIEVLINWIPMMLLIGVWVWFMRRYVRGNRTSSGRTCADLMEDMLNETKSLNANLVKILEKMDERISRLEDRSK